MTDADLDRFERIAAAAKKPPWGEWGHWSERYAQDVPLLLAEVHRLRADLASCRQRCEGLAERVAKQSELLSRRAEKPA